MTLMFRPFTGLGAALVVLSTLAAVGCGVAPRGVATGVRTDVLRAKSGGYSVRFQPRPMQRNLSGKPAALLAQRLEDEDGANAPAAPTDGLKPVPKPTTTPPTKPAADPREPGPVDDLHALLGNFGYNGTIRQMAAELRKKTFAYPINHPDSPGGWDPSVNPREHYEWWKKTLPADETGSYNDYLQQSLQIAQIKFDVVYYVWISKQYDPEKMKREGKTSPFVDLNEGLPIVKGIYGGGWLVEISPKATILDYLKIPPTYLKDYNHLIRIPEELYF